MFKKVTLFIVLFVAGMAFFAVAGVPDSPKAICKDGTESFSKTKSGTCSRHGGVKEWR